MNTNLAVSNPTTKWTSAVVYSNCYKHHITSHKVHKWRWWV